MQLVIVILIFTTINFTPSLAGLCRLSKGHKNYTCNGFPFRQMGGGRKIRQEIIRGNFSDCKEIHVKEDALQFPNLEYLILDCDIETIDVNGFRNLNRLKELDLGNNSIVSLPDNVFQSLGDLKKLNLSNNNLEEISKNVFNGLNNLKLLSLSYNLITKFDVKALDVLKGLEEIYLSNNKFDVVPARLFNKLTKLHTVDLSFNSIEDLGNLFRFTYDLEYLNLSNNLITDLPNQMFQSTNLKILDLSNNRLSVIYESGLKLSTLEQLHLQNNKISLFEVKGVGLNRIPLQYLDLTYNRLVYLEDNFIKIARYLVTFKIEGNPWDCNCYDKIIIARGDLSLEISSDYADGGLPLCITSTSSGNECNINKNNLEYYYKVFQEQLELRK